MFQCNKILLGLNNLKDFSTRRPFEQMMNAYDDI